MVGCSSRDRRLVALRRSGQPSALPTVLVVCLVGSAPLVSTHSSSSISTPSMGSTIAAGRHGTGRDDRAKAATVTGVVKESWRASTSRQPQCGSRSTARSHHAGVRRCNTTVIALWLGHADVRSTNAYLHADLGMKERALARVTSSPGRYRLPDRLITSGRPVNVSTSPRPSWSRSRSPQGNQRSAPTMIGIIPRSA
jgi:hypothetical protein